jgi:SAM-dependent methyltransferase
MFELGKTDHWWPIAKRYPSLSNHPNTLKPLGYAHIVNLIETFEPKTVLEVGHGAMSFIFKLFADKVEMWGLDDVVEDSSVSAEDLENVRKWNPEVKFVSGLLGSFLKELPDNYFDLVYSVSVIEHIPHEVLPSVFQDTYRILKPGGIVSHSYDVYYRQSTKEVFDAYEGAGFKWLKPKSTMNVFWEDWLTKPNDDMIDELFDKIVFENPMEVAEKYMWQQDRNYRNAPINYLTVLNAATKPAGEVSKKVPSKPSLKISDDYNAYTYSTKRHMKEFISAGYDKEVYGREIDTEYCDIKVYQNLLVHSFIKNNLESRSNILEIGDNISLVLLSSSSGHECQSIAVNSQKASGGNDKVRITEARIGKSEGVVDSGQFDFIFANSSLGQEKDGNFTALNEKMNDIRRLLKPGGTALLNFVGLYKDPLIWTPEIMRNYFERENALNKPVAMFKVLIDEDLFLMSEKYYNENWMKITSKSYRKFGKALSFAVFLRK